jgi:DUF4097 and DUF4098 domain-containing protein YvlB
MKKLVVVIVLIMALLVLCAAIGAIAYITLAPNGVNIGPAALNIQHNDTSYVETVKKNFPVGENALLELDNRMGDITITAGDVEEIQVAATKTSWGTNDEDAKANMADILLTMTQNGDQVTIKVDEPKAVQLNVQGQANTVDYTIVVPVKISLDVNTSSGDIALSGTQGKASLESDFGDVEVQDFQGGLVAISRSGNVTARNLDRIDGKNGDASLSSDFGTVTGENIVTNKIDAYSRSGDVRLTNVRSESEVRLTSDFGNLAFETGKAATVVAETRSGAVKLTDLSVAGLVSAKSDFGDINLDQVIALSYDLNTNSGKVVANAAQGAFKARSGFGDITVEGGKDATLDLQSGNGEIQYTGSLGAGPHALHTDFGDITLNVPAETPMVVDLKTEFGSITSDFKITVVGALDEKHWAGEIGTDGVAVNVDTKNGDIKLNIEP